MMEKTATLNLRVDPTLKKQAENILQRLGIPMSTAVDMFLKQITLVGGIRFSVTLPKVPTAVNVYLMTDDELHTKLRKGLEDVQAWRVQDADTAFQTFWRGLCAPVMSLSYGFSKKREKI